MNNKARFLNYIGTVQPHRLPFSVRIFLIILVSTGKAKVVRHLRDDHVAQLARVSIRRPHVLVIERHAVGVRQTFVDAFQEVADLVASQEVVGEDVVLHVVVGVDEEPAGAPGEFDWTHWRREKRGQRIVG